jgi:hypothetical protein
MASRPVTQRPEAQVAKEAAKADYRAHREKIRAPVNSGEDKEDPELQIENLRLEKTALDLEVSARELTDMRREAKENQQE